VEDIGQPIEGFDADLLMTAFAGIKKVDFEGVESLEGAYSVQKDGELVFARKVEQPISSAEKTISNEGYDRLFRNITTRLDFLPKDIGEVDILISRINTSERLAVKMKEEKSALNVKIVPLELLEDSRCPANANCIQAGTVRVKTLLASGANESEQIFILGETVSTETEEITLNFVEPIAETSSSPDERDYIFHFQIKKLN
jgi:hypothetical protein